MARRARKPSLPTRDILYREALTRFREDGFDAIPVSRLTQACGVAKGTFFLHYPTKEHLLSRWVEEALVTAQGAAEGAGGTDAILHALVALARAFRDDPALGHAAITRWSTLPAGDGNGTPPAAALTRWIAERLDETLAMAVPLSEVDNPTLATLVSGAFELALREDGSAAASPSPKAGPPPVERLLLPRVVFLLESAGLPAYPPTGS